MGNIEHIDRLETYIEEFGNEVSKIKTASEYLKLIKGFQAEITETSATLSNSSRQLKLYQEIMENKLELFLTTAKNIEVKQQSLEQIQVNINDSLSELKRSQLNVINGLSEVKELQEKNEREVMKALNDIHMQQEENKGNLTVLTKIVKNNFNIALALIASTLGLLVYTLVR